jgi:hypothetical protein
MQDTQIVPKKDIIILSGSADLKIDMIAALLLRYFSGYEYFPKKYFDRNNVSADTIILEYIQSDKKLIISALSDFYSRAVFKVVFINSGEVVQGISPYDYLVDLNKQHNDTQIVEEIIVAWGCWVDDRKVTKPL